MTTSLPVPDDATVVFPQVRDVPDDREIWRCPEGGCRVRLNAAHGLTDVQADNRAIARFVLNHYAESHPGWLIPMLGSAGLAPTDDHERLAEVRQALIDIGYFTSSEVGPDVAPRITELGEHLRQLRARVGDAEQPGPIATTSMLDAVRADLQGMTLQGVMPSTTAAMALWLAEVIDNQRATASPSAVARLVDSLRQTMRVLATGKDDSPSASLDALIVALSTPAPGNTG